MANYLGKLKSHQIYEVNREEYFNEYAYSNSPHYFYIREDNSLINDEGVRIGKIEVNMDGFQEFIEEEHQKYRAWRMMQDYCKEKIGCRKEVAEQCKKTEAAEDFWQKLQNDIDAILQQEFSY